MTIENVNTNIDTFYNVIMFFLKKIKHSWSCQFSKVYILIYLRDASRTGIRQIVSGKLKDELS